MKVQTMMVNIDAEESMPRIKKSLSVTRGIALLNPVNVNGEQVTPDLDMLKGTVADPTATWLQARVGGQEVWVKSLTPTFEVVRFQGHDFHAFRIASDWHLRVNELVDSEFCYNEQFKRALQKEISKFFENNVRSRVTGLPGFMWAWGHFSNVPNNHLGMDIEVANRYYKSVISAAIGLGIDVRGITPKDLKDLTPMDRNGVSIPTYGALLAGVKVAVVRHPASSANSADNMEISVVDSFAPMVGVNSATATARLGDFDHDLCQGGLTENSAKIVAALSQIRRNLGKGIEIIPAYVPFKPEQGNLTLQSIFWNGHFDAPDTGFSTLVGGEAKKAVGIFKQAFYWGLEGLLISRATREEILSVGEIVSQSTLVDEENRLAVLVRLEDCKKFADKPAYQHRLAVACLYATMYGLEEVLMDAAKKVIDPVLMASVSENSLDAMSVISHALTNGDIAWDELEAAGFETSVLKLAVDLCMTWAENPESGEFYAKYHLREALSAFNDPYDRLIMQKSKWLNEGDWETTKSLLDYSLNQYQWAFYGKRDLAEDARPALQVRPTKGVTFEVHTDYALTEKTEHGFNALADHPDYNPTVTLLFGKDDEGFNFLSVNKGNSSRIVDYGYNLRALPISLTDNGGQGKIIVSPTGTKYFGGVHVYCLEHHAHPLFTKVSQWDMDAVKGDVYPKDKTITLVKVSIVDELQMIASEAYLKAKFRGDKDREVEFRLEKASTAVRKAINALPRVEDAAGAGYLGEFIYVNLPGSRSKVVQWDRNFLHHTWLQLEKFGFDTRATAHAKKGSRLAVTDENTGMTVMQSILGFGQVTNKNRISKLDSTMVRHRLFETGTESTTRVITQLLQNVSKEVVVALINWKGFGPKPADETYRTIDGDQSMVTNVVQYLSVTAEEYSEWYSTCDNEELKKLADKKCANIKVSNDLEVPKYFIPEESGGITRDSRKVTLGIRPGVNQPIDVRLVASFKPLTEIQMQAKNWPKRLKETGNKRAMLVDFIDNEMALTKKEAFDQMLRMVNSQLDVPVDPTGYAPEQIVCKERSVKAYKAYKLGEEVVNFGEFNDLVGAIEAQLVAEKKSHEGLMFLYQVNSDDSLSPIMDGHTHVRAIVGKTTIMRSCYEDGWGSYGRILPQGLKLDPHLRLLTAEGFNFTGTDVLFMDKLRANVLAVENMVPVPKEPKVINHFPKGKGRGSASVVYAPLEFDV